VSDSDRGQALIAHLAIVLVIRVVLPRLAGIDESVSMHASWVRHRWTALNGAHRLVDNFDDPAGRTAPATSIPRHSPVEP